MLPLHLGCIWYCKLFCIVWYRTRSIIGVMCWPPTPGEANPSDSPAHACEEVPVFPCWHNPFFFSFLPSSVIYQSVEVAWDPEVQKPLMSTACQKRGWQPLLPLNKADRLPDRGWIAPPAPTQKLYNISMFWNAHQNVSFVLFTGSSHWPIVLIKVLKFALEASDGEVRLSNKSLNWS